MVGTMEPRHARETSVVSVVELENAEKWTIIVARA